MENYSKQKVHELLLKYGYDVLQNFGANGEDYYYTEEDGYTFLLHDKERVDEMQVLLIMELCNIPLWEFDHLYSE